MATAHADDPRAVFDGYQAAFATYREAALEFERRVRAALLAGGVSPVMVSARPKSAVELYKKQRRKSYEDFWQTCPDVLGVRIVVSVASEKISALDALAASPDFELFDVEDQTSDSDPEKLEYLGLHAHIRTTDIAGVDGKGVRCEVQIRTTAQHAWAETEHKYLYKKEEGIPRDIRRIFMRLLALVELFDDELQKGVDLVRSTPAFAEQRLVRELETRFASLGHNLGDEVTTREVLGVLAESGYPDPQDLLGTLLEYLHAHEGEARAVFEAHGPSTSGFDVDTDWLISQPESLLLLALLEKDEYRLSNALDGSDLASYVRPLARWSDHVGFASS